MKSTQEKVFVVVDPTASEHIALQRAIITAKFRKPLPKLYIFVGVDAESVDTRATNDTLYKNTTWFESAIHGPLRAAECALHTSLAKTTLRDVSTAIV